MTNPALGFIQGHTYRLYFMVHDGDQNKTGGDAGQACVTFTYNGPTQPGAPTPTPTATPTTPPVAVVAIGNIFGGGNATKTVAVTFQNNTAVSQVLVASPPPTLSISWPQPTVNTGNGTLKQITMGGTTIFNTTSNSPLNNAVLLGTNAQRTIAAGACATLTFTFNNNVSTNPADYTGSATFNPFGTVPMFLP